MSLMSFMFFHDAKMIQAVVCLFPCFESVDESWKCWLTLVDFSVLLMEEIRLTT